MTFPSLILQRLVRARRVRKLENTLDLPFYISNTTERLLICNFILDLAIQQRKCLFFWGISGSGCQTIIEKIIDYINQKTSLMATITPLTLGPIPIQNENDSLRVINYYKQSFLMDGYIKELLGNDNQVFYHNDGRAEWCTFKSNCIIKTDLKIYGALSKRGPTIHFTKNIITKIQDAKVIISSSLPLPSVLIELVKDYY